MTHANTKEKDITITLPDGATRSYAAGVTGMEIADSIAKSLAKAALVIEVNGELWDLARPIETDAKIALVTNKDERALDIIRHDCAHVLAEAVQELFPGTQVTIGPAIENGFYYDFYREESFSPEDFAKIEAKMHAIIKANKPFTRHVIDRDDGIKLFEEKGEKFKAELIQDLPEGETITLYDQGEWIDLCKGPHAPSTGYIGKAFKLTKLAGSYWRGDSSREQLQRIYATAWRTQEDLDQYLTQLEEAEKRDHRKLGQTMDLFHFQEEAPGQVFWHAKGWWLYNTVVNHMRKKLERYGYFEVNTPQMLNSRFWTQSGHWDKYQDNMFVIHEEDSEYPYAIKPMSCPGNAQLYMHDQRSYRDLPMRMAEFGHVFRREASGARHGLMRVQAFTQDDAHIFCTDDQLEDEVVLMCDLIEETYRDFGFNEVLVKFSDRPEQRIGSDEDWDRAEGVLMKVCKRMGFEWVHNPGDGAFYAPKLDFVVKDAMGRDWQCGTIQVDMNMPGRLGLSYVDQDGEKQKPNMVHRAICGSIERFIGILLENYAGNLPLWLAPTQVVVASITGEVEDYAQKVGEQLKDAGIRAELDIRNEKINYKIREHSHAKVPAIFVVGKRESEDGTVAIRRLGSQDQNVISLDQALENIVKESIPPDLGP